VPIRRIPRRNSSKLFTGSSHHSSPPTPLADQDVSAGPGGSGACFVLFFDRGTPSRQRDSFAALGALAAQKASRRPARSSAERERVRRWRGLFRKTRPIRLLGSIRLGKRSANDGIQAESSAPAEYFLMAGQQRPASFLWGIPAARHHESDAGPRPIVPFPGRIKPFAT